MQVLWKFDCSKSECWPCVPHVLNRYCVLNESVDARMCAGHTCDGGGRFGGEGLEVNAKVAKVGVGLELAG